MTQDELKDLYTRMQWHIGSNPNGGANIYSCGVMMLYITILVFLYQSAMINAGSARTRVFNSEFMKQFEGQFTPKIRPGGAPDNGCGYYSDKLGYKDWYNFAKVQRVHLNFYETITPICVMGCISILKFPPIAFIVMPIYIFGRFMYGPLIFARCPSAFAATMMILFIIIPFWVLCYSGIGLILQPFSQLPVDPENDPSIKVAKWFPFPAGDFSAILSAGPTAAPASSG